MRLIFTDEDVTITDEEFGSLLDYLYSKNMIKGWQSKEEIIEWFSNDREINYTHYDNNLEVIETKRWLKSLRRSKKLKNVTRSELADIDVGVDSGQAGIYDDKSR